MIATELKGSLQSHAARLSAKAGTYAEKERREKSLAELRRVEQGEQASLTAFKAEFQGTLTQLMSVDWPTLGRSVNVGSAEADTKSIMADLEDGLKFHEGILAAFAEDREPSDAMLERAAEVRGLAEKLRTRMHSLHDTVSKL